MDFCVRMCRKLYETDTANGLHFYTLNREVATIEILKVGFEGNFDLNSAGTFRAAALIEILKEGGTRFLLLDVEGRF